MNKTNKNKILNQIMTQQIQPSCCICIKPISVSQRALSSAICIQRNGNNSHKICQQCWWDSFAQETICHNCPGCVKGLSLTIIQKPIEFVIDLTNDDE